MSRKNKSNSDNPFMRFTSYIGIGVLSIVIVVIFIFLMSIRIPYNFVPKDRLNNPKEYNQNAIYDEYSGHIDFDKLKANTSKFVYQESGIQIYWLYFETPENIRTDSELVTYAEAYINEKIKDEYGIYICESRYPDDFKGDWYASLRCHIIYGSEVQKFMDIKATRIFNAAYHHYDRINHYNVFQYYGREDNTMFALQETITRLMHPYKVLINAIIKFLTFAIILIFITILIRRKIKKQRQIEILSTSMEDLVEQHIEDMADRYNKE